MGRVLIRLGAWKRSALLAASVALLLQPSPVLHAAAETPAVDPERSASTSADTSAEKINASLMRHDDETFVALLSQNPEVVAHVYSNGWTLLEEAADAGSLPAVEALLRQGADPNLGKRPPLSLALSGAREESRFPSSSSIPRTTFYEIVVALLEAGADYQFMDLPNASFIEILIMDICESSHFSADHLAPFRDADMRFQVERHLLRNMETIRTLANIGLKEPSCISFFDRRIISMGKA